MPPPAALRIVTVEVPVSDLGRSVEWYEATLGLKRAWSDGRAAVMRQAHAPAPFIFLVQTDDPARLGFGSPMAARHSIVDFYTPDLAGMHRYLRERGVEVDGLTERATGFGFSDPDGNRLGACCVEA